MAFEVMLLFLLAVSGIFLIGIPFFKLVKRIVPTRRDPVKEAQDKLMQAKLDAEAARLNKETEKVYQHLYDDLLQDEDDTDKYRSKL